MKIETNETNKEQEGRRSGAKLETQANLHSAVKSSHEKKQTNNKEKQERYSHRNKQSKKGKAENIKETNDDI